MKNQIRMLVAAATLSLTLSAPFFSQAEAKPLDTQDFVKSNADRLHQMGTIDAFVGGAQMPLDLRSSINQWAHNKGSIQVPKVTSSGTTLNFDLGKKKATVSFGDAAKHTILINGHRFMLDVERSVSENLDNILELIDPKHTIVSPPQGGPAQIPALDIGAVAITGVLAYSYGHQTHGNADTK